MTPIQITAIVNAILELRKKDVTMQKASDLCHEAFYEDGYGPCLTGITDGALKVLDIVHPEISDWISYFVYEVPGLKRNNPDYDVTIRWSGIDFHMNTKENLVNFLANAYPE